MRIPQGTVLKEGNFKPLRILLRDPAEDPIAQVFAQGIYVPDVHIIPSNGYNTPRALDHSYECAKTFILENGLDSGIDATDCAFADCLVELIKLSQ